MKIDIKKILNKQGLSITECAKCFNRSRQDFYRIITNCINGEQPSPNLAVNWAVEYLFSTELSRVEFNNRLVMVQEKLSTSDKSGKEKNIVKEIKGKRIPLYKFGKNEYIIIDNIQNFKYEKLDDNVYELTINHTSKTISRKDLITFLSIFNLEIEE